MRTTITFHCADEPPEVFVELGMSKAANERERDVHWAGLRFVSPLGEYELVVMRGEPLAAREWLRRIHTQITRALTEDDGQGKA